MGNVNDKDRDGIESRQKNIPFGFQIDHNVSNVCNQSSKVLCKNSKLSEWYDLKSTRTRHRHLYKTKVKVRVKVNVSMIRVKIDAFAQSFLKKG